MPSFWRNSLSFIIASGKAILLPSKTPARSRLCPASLCTSCCLPVLGGIGNILRPAFGNPVVQQVKRLAHPLPKVFIPNSYLSLRFFLSPCYVVETCSRRSCARSCALESINYSKVINYFSLFMASLLTYCTFIFPVIKMIVLK